MEIINKELQKVEVVTDILCDCCGKTCKTKEKKSEKDGSPSREFEFMKLEAVWGFQSNKDTEIWTAHLCEKCVDEKLSFINFVKKNYL